MHRYKLTARQEAAINKLKNANIYHVRDWDVVQIAEYFEEIFGELGWARVDPQQGDPMVKYIEGLADFLDANGKAKTDFKSLCELAGYVEESDLIIKPEGDIYLVMHE